METTAVGPQHVVTRAQDTQPGEAPQTFAMVVTAPVPLAMVIGVQPSSLWETSVGHVPLGSAGSAGPGVTTASAVGDAGAATLGSPGTSRPVSRVCQSNWVPV